MSQDAFFLSKKTCLKSIFANRRVSTYDISTLTIKSIKYFKIWSDNCETIYET